MSDGESPNQAQRMLLVFEEGKRFTEELLRENERLRRLVASLRSEIRDQNDRLAEAPRLDHRLRASEAENARLRAAYEELRGQLASVEEENRDFADRYVRVERQYSDLIQMYVASYQLHSTLSYDSVVESLRAIIVNMIGAAVFGLYLVEGEPPQLQLIAHEGLEDAPDHLALDGNDVGAAVREGQVRVTAAADLGAGAPLAVIPMRVGDQVLGAIAIHQLLSQKVNFGPLDFELFELLGGHAGTALYSASLYELSERKRTTLEGFMKLLRE